VELVQARLVTEDVAGLAAFYAGLVKVKVPVNEYYVEVPAGPLRSVSPRGGSPSTARTWRRFRGEPFAGNDRCLTQRSAILEK
jgi:hypothetical protein